MSMRNAIMVHAVAAALAQMLFAIAGYDNMEVNLEPVIDHIKAQNFKALQHEQNAKRETAMSKWQVCTVSQLAH